MATGNTGIDFRQAGFSIAELAVTLMVVTIVSGIGFSIYYGAKEHGEKVAGSHNIKQLGNNCLLAEAGGVQLSSFSIYETKRYLVSSTFANECKGVIGLISQKPEKLPSFFYDSETGVFSCSYSDSKATAFPECAKIGSDLGNQGCNPDSGLQKGMSGCLEWKDGYGPTAWDPYQECSSWGSKYDCQGFELVYPEWDCNVKRKSDQICGCMKQGGKISLRPGVSHVGLTMLTCFSRHPHKELYSITVRKSSNPNRWTGTKDFPVNPDLESEIAEAIEAGLFRSPGNFKDKYPIRLRDKEYYDRVLK